MLLVLCRLTHSSPEVTLGTPPHGDQGRRGTRERRSGQFTFTTEQNWPIISLLLECFLCSFLAAACWCVSRGVAAGIVWSSLWAAGCALPFMCIISSHPHSCPGSWLMMTPFIGGKGTLQQFCHLHKGTHRMAEAGFET